MMNDHHHHVYDWNFYDRTTQENLDILNHPVGQMKFNKLILNPPRDINDVTLLQDFLRNTASIEELVLNCNDYERVYHTDTVRDLISVANSNRNISSLVLTLPEYSNYNINDVYGYVVAGQNKLKAVTVNVASGHEEAVPWTCPLPNLQTFKVHSCSCVVLQNFMIFLSNHPPNKLTDFEFELDDDTPGLDNFLASQAAANLKYVEIMFHYSLFSDESFGRLIAGLTRNSSIDNLAIEFQHLYMSESKATMLGDYLRHSTLKRIELRLTPQEEYAQRLLFNGLYDNESIREVVLEDGFFSSDELKRNSNQLLVHNRHIQTFCCPSECAPYIAEGLSQNSTLKRLRLGRGWRDTTAVLQGIISSDYIAPILVAIQSDFTGLQKMDLKACSIDADVQNMFTALVEELKELTLDVEFGFGGDQILALLSSCAQSTSSSLERLEITTHFTAASIPSVTWTEIASTISKLPLLDLIIRIKACTRLRTMADEVVGVVHQELLDGMQGNTSLENVRIVFPVNDLYDDFDFHSKMKQYCARNLTVKTSNALMIHQDKFGGDEDNNAATTQQQQAVAGKRELLIKCLPDVLTAIHKRCCSFVKRTNNNNEAAAAASNYYEELKGTILYSALRGKPEFQKDDGEWVWMHDIEN